jgi:hypothetical protein
MADMDSSSESRQRQARTLQNYWTALCAALLIGVVMYAVATAT